MEARNNKYFVDGFLIRHFGIFPIGFDKDDMFEEQKVFLMYLMGTIPEYSTWARNVEYQSKLEEIKQITYKDIEVNQYELDIARLQKKNIDDIKKQRLVEHKKLKIRELNESFGIKEEEQEIERKIETPNPEQPQNPNRLWDILNGKGLVKENGK